MLFFSSFFVQETENIGNAHVALAQQLLEYLDRNVRDFRESQREKRKRVREYLNLLSNSQAW